MYRVGGGCVPTHFFSMEKFYQILKRDHEPIKLGSRINILWISSWNIQFSHRRLMVRMNIMKYYFHTDPNTLTHFLRVIKCFMPCKFSLLIWRVKSMCLLCMMTCVRQFKKHVIVLDIYSCIINHPKLSSVIYLKFCKVSNLDWAHLNNSFI